MKPNDKAEFAKVVMAFAEIKGKQLSLPAIELYWSAMQAWGIEDFKAAAQHLLLNGNDFMPQPHHFEDLRKAGRNTAGEAFGKALGWARSGAYRHPAKTPDAILIDRVVHALGGWIAITSCDEEKLHFLERRFVEHFETIQDSSDVREALPAIAKPDWLQLGVEARRKALTKEPETET